MPNFIVLSQTMYKKGVAIFFYIIQYFGAPGDPAGQSSSGGDPDVQQGPSYQSAIFHPTLTTRYLLPTFVDFV